MNHKDQKKETQDDKIQRKKKDNFWSTVILDVCIIVAIVMTNVNEPGTKDYYYANNGLFLLCLLVSLAFIFTNERTKSIVDTAKKASRRKSLVGYDEWTDMAWLIAYLLAIIGFFIVDLSFFNHSGLRISAVVGVILFRMVKSIFSKKT